MAPPVTMVEIVRYETSYGKVGHLVRQNFRKKDELNLEGKEHNGI